jgi:hypothetical protein
LLSIAMKTRTWHAWRKNRGVPPSFRHRLHNRSIELLFRSARTKSVERNQPMISATTRANAARDGRRTARCIYEPSRWTFIASVEQQAPIFTVTFHRTNTALDALNAVNDGGRPKILVKAPTIEPPSRSLGVPETIGGGQFLRTPRGPCSANASMPRWWTQNIQSELSEQSSPRGRERFTHLVLGPTVLIDKQRPKAATSYLARGNRASGPASNHDDVPARHDK